MTDLTGKTIIITGASRDLGEATARLAAKAGANVALAARSEQAISAIASDITNAGGKAAAFACDVAHYDEVVGLVTEAENRFGQVDALINNASVIEPIAFLNQSDPAAWGTLININVKGPYYGIRAVLPGMLARGQGTIITVGSGAAHFALDGWSAYCTSKAAALMLTSATHKETGDKGIVNINFSPGTIATEMQKTIRESGINPVSQMDPDSLGDPLVPAQVLTFLCGPAGTNYAGQDLRAGDAELRKAAGIN